MSSDVILSKIERLADLKKRGLLSEEEFSQQKSNLLAEASAPPPAPPQISIDDLNFQSVSNAITSKLGLDHVEGFSLKAFLSDVFKSHDHNEVENIFSVGSIVTTPNLSEEMTKLPNPWIFFRVLIGALITYGAFYYAWISTGAANVIPGLIIVGSFAIPIATLILFFEINTPRNVSLIRVIQLVAMGGGVSILLSLLLYSVFPMLGILGAPSAGIIEEIGKLATVLLVMKFIPMERYPYLLNAILFGAAVGTGFAAFESAGYALNAGIYSGSEGMFSSIQLRGLMSPFAHIVWTAIATGAYWRVRKGAQNFRAVFVSPKFWTLMCVPMGLHFVWNLPFEGPFMIKYVFLGFAAWVVVISLIQTGLNEVRAIYEGRAAQ